MFLLEAIKTIKTTGAIAPCTNSSAKKVASIIKIKQNEDDAFTIAELGAGTGIFTKELVKQFPKAIIHAVEINSTFAHQLKKINSSTLKIHNTDAKNISQLNTEFDIIVSTIPHSFLSLQEKEDLLKHSFSVLKKGGLYIIGQYSETSVKYFNKYFHNEPIFKDRVLSALPPLKILVYKK